MTTTLAAPMTSAPVAVVVPPAPVGQPTVFNLPAGAVLHAPQAAPAAAEAALKSLRGFKAAKRRVVWCNSAELVRTANQCAVDWGRKLVEIGGADLAVVCGAGADELALAARDAGMALGHVVVCRDDATARNVLGDSVAAGDVVLALGVSGDSCQRLVERLESKFTPKKKSAKAQLTQKC